MGLPVYVITSQRYLWALRGFAHLFGIYWSSLQPVVVATDVRVPYKLPRNFEVTTVNDWKPLPKEKWSDGLITLLKSRADPHFILMLDDYWIVRTVDHGGIRTLSEFAAMNRDILRLDLTDDRQYNGDARGVGSWGHYDLVETPGSSPYQMSLQAAIWKRDLLLSILEPGMSPWDVELNVSPRLHDRTDLRVIGTRQCPIRYINVFKGGKSKELLNLDGLPNIRKDELEKLGWLSRD